MRYDLSHHAWIHLAPTQLLPMGPACRCAAEFIATALGVGLGNGAMANAVLGYTKAHDMGYGWVALAAGLSYALVMVRHGQQCMSCRVAKL